MDAPRERRPHRPCRLVVAAAGYGKTTALRRWFPPAAARWYRGVAPADLPRLVRDGAAGDQPVVVDDLPDLPTETVRALFEVASELPATASVVLASRWPPADPGARSLGRGGFTQTGPAELALSAEQVADLLTGEYGLDDSELPRRLHEATGGWPALVHLAVESLLSDGVPTGSLAPAVAAPGSPLATYLAEEVLSTLPPEAGRLIRHLGDLAPLPAGLCRALGHRRADETVRLLARTGLLARAGAPAVRGGPAPVERIIPVVTEVLRHGHRRPGAARTASTAAAAAAWYSEAGPPVAAAHAYARAGDHDGCAGVLHRHGDRMLAAGHADVVVRLIAALPGHLRTRRLHLLRGDALRAAGDLDAAARAYGEVADTEPHWDAGLAWRVGRVHYQRADPRGALAAFARCAQPAAGSADDAFLLAYTAHALQLAGDPETAIGSARRAVAAAQDAGDDDALATAHASVALCLGLAGDGAGSEGQYSLAVPLAERAGDVALLARIFTNRTALLLGTARYADAQATARTCVRYAEVAGSPDLGAIATCNEGDALLMLGRYDEAVKRYEQALRVYHRMGSRRVAGAHLGLGEVYRRRGWREQARAAYEEAVKVADDAGNTHVLVPALAGLALVLFDEEATAREHADRAARICGTEHAAVALVAQGWLAWYRGDLSAAGCRAGEAARIARGRRDRAGLADALELRAAAETDADRIRDALREADAIWTEAGAAMEAARIRVKLGQLPAAGTEDRLRGLLASEHLAAAGALVDRLRPPPGVAPASDGGPDVVIRALGRFEVRIGDRAVPPSLWQSRKARDLLRILVARRGRPVPRDELCELMWPDDDPDRTGHRLSVLLSIVRGVLDPAKAYPTDHYLVADQASIALDIARVRVDVEEFLAHVAHGRRLVERHALAEARALLMAVDRQYRADAFEDEPYASWCAPLREEARAAYVRLLRMLAHVSRVEAGPEVAASYLLRLLERDPYDEPAHRALVRTLVAGGQHGEARRAFSRYREAMRSIGVRPPDEAILLPVHPGRTR